MKLDLIKYSKIKADYQLCQPLWLKGAIILIGIGVLVLAAYLASTSHEGFMFKVGLTLIVIVFIVAFTKQRSSGIWSTLLANKQSLYIIASTDGTEFIQIPWRYIQDIKLVMYGLNKRGLVINLRSSLLADTERNLIRNHLNVHFDDESRISVSIPTGISNREEAIQELKSFQS